jgi:hypothetical protein
MNVWTVLAMVLYKCLPGRDCGPIWLPNTALSRIVGG